jgi:CRISPR-associated protein Csd2
MPETNGQPVQNRYDFVLFFDATDANPNGDPDAGNLPRIDPETGQGLVTDVCLKRKVRNYVALKHGGEPPYEIYVKERAVLNEQHEKAYKAEGLTPVPKRLPKDVAEARRLTAWMCRNFFDVRTFGAVMTTEVNAGQVRGPIQVGIARSLHSIVSSEFSITRVAVTNKKDFEGTADKEGKDREMGRKFTVPYGLYRVHGYVNPNLADGDTGTGFSESDLELLKEAIGNLFEFDASAARPPGSMRPVACIAFKHESRLGNARADQLFKRVTCLPRPGVQPLSTQRDTDGRPLQAKPDDRPPRSSEDYHFTAPPPGPLEDVAGVTVEHWVAWE